MSNAATTTLPTSILPDFTGVASFSEIQNRFVTAAGSLMSGFLIQGHQEWRITALELYLFTETEVWKDIYTHENEAQKIFGVWYVHQRGSGFRAPNRSGIDISCGKAGISCGILVRQVCGQKGPATALKNFVRGSFVFNRHDRWSPEDKMIIDQINKKDVFKCQKLALVPCSKKSFTVWIGPRIGLRNHQLTGSNPEGISFRDAYLRVASQKMDSKMVEWK